MTSAIIRRTGFREFCLINSLPNKDKTNTPCRHCSNKIVKKSSSKLLTNKGSSTSTLRHRHLLQSANYTWSIWGRKHLVLDFIFLHKEEAGNLCDNRAVWVVPSLWGRNKEKAELARSPSFPLKFYGVLRFCCIHPVLFWDYLKTLDPEKGRHKEFNTGNVWNFVRPTHHHET